MRTSSIYGRLQFQHFEVINTGKLSKSLDDASVHILLIMDACELKHHVMKHISNTSLLGTLESVLTNNRLWSYMNELSENNLLRVVYIQQQAVTEDSADLDAIATESLENYSRKR